MTTNCEVLLGCAEHLRADVEAHQLADVPGHPGRDAPAAAAHLRGAHLRAEVREQPIPQHGRERRLVRPLVAHAAELARPAWEVAGHAPHPVLVCRPALRVGVPELAVGLVVRRVCVDSSGLQPRQQLQHSGALAGLRAAHQQRFGLHEAVLGAGAALGRGRAEGRSGLRGLEAHEPAPEV
eukprot:CAMPEP_0179078164 /NCGR_PEP_ID=MMETSP0796-20121207/34985_1 /TAXON_ID=73915 /ORGANISM="Pyrodinium bahamense, Strain pbaha01" /LENGTH=180 /DNA_ID=CAMNT_0020775459 /DNA_START=564 /DNA_END=1102 /DNA_ORIENTATION=-